jgi:hypothetical protein
MNVTHYEKPALFLEENIAKLGRTPFIQNSVIDIKEKEKANETMSEDKTRDLDQQVLGPFVKSFHRRYERWKRQDLLSVALQTFPRQVKKEKVIENLTCLKAEFDKKLSDEG